MLDNGIRKSRNKGYFHHHGNSVTTLVWEKRKVEKIGIEGFYCMHHFSSTVYRGVLISVGLE